MIKVENMSNLMLLCGERYDSKTLQHAVRVAKLAHDNPVSNTVDKNMLICLALAHDLIEDTETSYEEIVDCIISDEAESWSSNIEKKSFVKRQLCLLTKEEEVDYLDYIREIKASGSLYAYIIKLADMKDHLLQKDTLTDKLREKYWNALPELL